MRRGGGSIINLSSIAVRNGGGPGSVLYAAAKGFVATATRGWAKEPSMGRAGLAEECAGAFLYLASEQMSGYVTRQMIEVNGGQYMP